MGLPFYGIYIYSEIIAQNYIILIYATCIKTSQHMWYRGLLCQYKFLITSGIRQGSPTPFACNLYDTEISLLMNKAIIRGNMGETIVTNMLYGDVIYNS